MDHLIILDDYSHEALAHHIVKESTRYSIVHNAIADGYEPNEAREIYRSIRDSIENAETDGSILTSAQAPLPPEGGSLLPPDPPAL